jgi:hypothetical protein
MPWTFAHPAAVLPLRRLCASGPLSFTALAVGSMSPDFGYYLGPLEPVVQTHTLYGLVVFCLPAGLLALLLLDWLRDPVARVLPEPHRGILHSVPPTFRSLDLARFAVILLSLALGAATHVVWDSFTHHGRYFVEQIDLLRLPLLQVQHRQFRIFDLLQHASTLAGIAIVAAAYRAHVRRVAGTMVRDTADRRRTAVLAAMIAAGVAFALPVAWLETVRGSGLDVSMFVVRAIIHATTTFFVLLIAAALWPRGVTAATAPAPARSYRPPRPACRRDTPSTSRTAAQRRPDTAGSPARR